MTDWPTYKRADPNTSPLTPEQLERAREVMAAADEWLKLYGQAIERWAFGQPFVEPAFPIKLDPDTGERYRGKRGGP